MNCANCNSQNLQQISVDEEGNIFETSMDDQESFYILLCLDCGCAN